MTITTWLLFGFTVGIIAHFLERKRERSSIIGAMLLGIVGAFIGGTLANLTIGLGNFSDFPTLMIVISGSLILLYISKVMHSTR